MSKPKPGVCGLCGTAVVQAEEPKRGWQHTPNAWTWDTTVGWGHFYLELDPDYTLQLVKVRCEICFRRALCG